MFEYIISLDHSLLLLLNGSDCLFMDGVMWYATKTVTWVPLILSIVWVLGKNNNLWRTLLTICMVALLITITDQFSSSFCKPYFHRFRPTHHPVLGSMVDLVRGYTGGNYGFFSSHAANTFGAATFLSLLFCSRRFTLVAFAWATLSSYSRIYLGVHYPGDVLVGALFGAMVGYAISWITGKLLIRIPSTPHKQGEDFLPRYSNKDVNIVAVTFAVTLFYLIIRGVIFSITE